MTEFLAIDSPAAIALAAVAGMAWSICLVMAFMRWRAFHQRADLSWIAAYLCLVGVAIGQGWTANAWRSLLHESQSVVVTGAPAADDGVIPTTMVATLLAIHAFFALAAILALFANRRRADAFDV